MLDRQHGWLHWHNEITAPVASILWIELRMDATCGKIVATNLHPSHQFDAFG